MPYHRAECGTCLVHLVRILSITLWLWFKTVNTLFLLVVFIFIAIFIFAVRCRFLMAAVFISAVELLGGEEPQCLNVLVRSYLFVCFFATCYAGDQDISKCVYSSIFAMRFELTGKCCIRLYLRPYCRRNTLGLQGVLACCILRATTMFAVRHWVSNQRTV